MNVTAKRHLLVAMIESLRVLNVHRLDRRHNPQYGLTGSVTARAALPLVLMLQSAGIDHIGAVRSRRSPALFIPGANV